MALVTQPADGLWTSQLKNNARQGRALLQSLFANFDATIMNGTRSGVIPTTGLGGANDMLPFLAGGLQVSVSQGSGIAHKSGQGPMLGWNTSVKTVTLADAPASNPRNDIIVMRMYDLAAGDTSPDGQPCRIEPITGTPNAAPTDPVTPNAYGVITAIPAQAGLGTGGVAIPIARAQVSTAGVVTLTDLRRAGSLLGGPVFFLPGDNVGGAATRSGEISWNPATSILAVSDTTGARKPIRYGDYIGGEWRASSGQTLATGSTKLTFPTNVRTANGITFNGTDTFTVVSSRPYHLWAQLRTVALVNGGVVFGAPTYADGTHLLPFNGFTGGPDYGIGGTVWLDAGTQFCVYFYNNGSSTSVNHALRPAQVKIWAAP